MPNNTNNQKKYASLSTLQTFLDNLKTTFSSLSHKHTISDITDYTVDTSLSSTSNNPIANSAVDAEFEAVSQAMSALDLALDGKADASHNHDSEYDEKGAAKEVSDTLKEHTDNTDVHVTTSNKSNWNSAYTHSTSAHARTDATKVEDSTTNGNIKINGTETNVYSHPNSGVSAGTYKSVTVNAQGHVTAGSNPTTLSGYGITDAETKTDASAKLTEAKTYTDTVASGKSDTSHKHDNLYDAKGAAADSLASAKSYTDTKTANLASTSAVDTKISTHNTSTAAHNDIRDLISGLTTRLNTLADSDDTTLDQMGEVVAYIKNNKSLIDGITTSKVNVSDIIDNLTTNVADKPLSAAQGVLLNSFIDENRSLYQDVDDRVTILENIDHEHDNLDVLDSITTEKIESWETAHRDIANDLEWLKLGTEGDFEYLNEYINGINGQLNERIDSTDSAVSGKADKEHTHDIADVSGLQSALDGKAASSHGTHVTYSTTVPVMDGTASVGSASTVARSDHKHPTDTSRASKTEFDTHTSNTTVHITSAERVNWNAAKTHADSAHAPSNAEKNQNAFSNIKVGSTTIAADTVTDTLELVGSNVTITPDTTNDKVTFSILDASTGNKGVVQLTNSTSSTSTTTAATPSSVKSAYDLANTAKTNAATAQTRADSAYTLAESKVDSLSDLGITATATELNYVDGVTSNVQTQLDNKLPRNMIAYGTCSTAEDVAEKVVTTTNGNFQLVAGAIIHVNFTYANSASFVKLAIDGNEAKSAKKYGSWTLEGGEWKKGQVVKFVYDGYSFYMEGGNTTIEAGGTGADNVEDARENLSVYSKEDHAWTLLYDSGEITGNVNAFSGISVAGYNNIAVAIKCVNTSGNSAARAGSIYISTQTGVKYQFPVLTNLFTTSANTSAGMAIFNRVGDYLVCPYAARNINAPNFLKTSLGGTADNLTPIGGGIMRCISPMSSVIVSSLDQNSSYYFGAGSQVLVWGWNA